MVENGKIDVDYAEVMRIVTENELVIVKTFYPDEQLTGEENFVPIVLRSLWSPSSTFFEIKVYDKNRKEYPFLLKLYNMPSQRHVTANGARPWDRAELAYDFLREAREEGVKSTLKYLHPYIPRYIPRYLHPKGTRALFLEWLGESPIEPVVESMAKKQKMEFLSGILGFLALVQYEATEHLNEISDYVKENIFANRSLEEKARDYFSKVDKKATEEEIESFVSAYTKLIGKTLTGKKVSHGDLSPTNIFLSEKGVLYLTDPDHMKRGANEFNDLGSLLAYSSTTLNKEEWDELAINFKTSQIELAARREGGEPSITGLRERKIKGIIERVGERFGIGVSIPPTIQSEREALFNLYGNIFHYSLRIMAKNTESHRYEDTKQQKQNLEIILDEFIRRPKKFGLSAEDKRNAITLYDRVIPQELEPEQLIEKPENLTMTPAETSQAGKTLKTVAS